MRNKLNLFKKAISVFTGIAFLFLGYFIFQYFRQNNPLQLDIENKKNHETLFISEADKQINKLNNLFSNLESHQSDLLNQYEIPISLQEQSFFEFVNQCQLKQIRLKINELSEYEGFENYRYQLNEILSGIEIVDINMKTDTVVYKFANQNQNYSQLAISYEILCHLGLLEGKIKCPVVNLERAEQLARSLIEQDELNSYPYVLLSLIYDHRNDKFKSSELLVEAESKTDHFNIYFEPTAQKMMQMYNHILDYILVSQVTSTLPMPQLFKIGEYLKSKKSFFVFQQMIKRNIDPNRFMESSNLSYLEYYVSEKYLNPNSFPIKSKEFVRYKLDLYKKDLYKQLGHLNPQQQCNSEFVDNLLSYFRSHAVSSSIETK